MLILEVALGIVLAALILAYLPYVIALLLGLVGLAIVGLIALVVWSHWTEWGPMIRAFGGFALAIVFVCYAAFAIDERVRQWKARKAMRDS